MPDPGDFDNQSDWMSACVPEVEAEGKSNEQATAQCLGMWNNAMTQNTLVQFSANISQAVQPKQKTFMNRDYWVVPAVLLQPQVLHNNIAPQGVFVDSETIRHSLPSWNGRPVTFDHPVDSDGLPSLANDPDILENYWAGWVFNAYMDNEDKLRAELWVAADLDQPMVNQIAEGQPIEVSTGYPGQAEPSEGSFNGESFVMRQTEIYPDHLAILPSGKTGACSYDDGCGVRNSRRKQTIMANSQLQYNQMLGPVLKTVREQKDMTPEQAASAMSEHMAPATLTADQVTQIESGDIKPSMAVMEAMGSAFGVTSWLFDEAAFNRSDRLKSTQQTSSATESETMTDQNTQTDTSQNTGDCTCGGKAPVQNAEQPQDLSLDQARQYLSANAAKQLDEALEVENNTRTEIVTRLAANQGCEFQEDELKGMPLKDLQRIDKMVSANQSKASETPAQPANGGQDTSQNAQPGYFPRPTDNADDSVSGGDGSDIPVPKGPEAIFNEKQKTAS